MHGLETVDVHTVLYCSTDLECRQIVQAILRYTSETVVRNTALLNSGVVSFALYREELST